MELSRITRTEQALATNTHSPGPAAPSMEIALEKKGQDEKISIVVNGPMDATQMQVILALNQSFQSKNSIHTTTNGNQIEVNATFANTTEGNQMLREALNHTLQLSSEVVQTKTQVPQNPTANTGDLMTFALINTGEDDIMDFGPSDEGTTYEDDEIYGGNTYTFPSAAFNPLNTQQTHPSLTHNDMERLSIHHNGVQFPIANTTTMAKSNALSEMYTPLMNSVPYNRMLSTEHLATANAEAGPGFEGTWQTDTSGSREEQIASDAKLARALQEEEEQSTYTENTYKPTKNHDGQNSDVYNFYPALSPAATSAQPSPDDLARQLAQANTKIKELTAQVLYMTKQIDETKTQLLLKENKLQLALQLINDGGEMSEAERNLIAYQINK